MGERSNRDALRRLAGAIFVAIAAVIAASELYAGPLGWLAWTFGIGGAFLLIGAAICAYIDRVDG